MKCEELKNIFYEKRIDEIPPQENELIRQHISSCSECRLFVEKHEKAESILAQISLFTPVPADEELLTAKIMNRVARDVNKSHELNGWFDKLITFVELPKIKYALNAVLILITVAYFSEEYDAVKKISSLENRFNNISSHQLYEAHTISQSLGAVGLMYKVYKFVNNESEYVDVSDNWLLIKKEKLSELLSDYDKLDDSQKQSLLELKKELLGNKEIKTESELKLDKQKIEKTIESLNSKRGGNEK